MSKKSLHGRLSQPTDEQLFGEVASMIEAARQRTAAAINSELKRAGYCGVPATTCTRKPRSPKTQQPSLLPTAARSRLSAACPSSSCDNLKTGVRRPDRYESDIHAPYADLAAHYHTAILPARVRKPRDKAKVEAGVLLACRQIMAPLRHRTFFTLAELNEAIAALVEAINARPVGMTIPAFAAFSPTA